MTDILFSIGSIVGLSFIVLMVAFVIPRLVVFSVKTGEDPNHIYNIFMEESGYRGCRITSAAVCLFPFIGISKPSIDVEGVVLVCFASIVSFILHLPVYKGYPVLSRNMKFVLIALVSSNFLVSMLARKDVVSDGVSIAFMMLSGSLWGGFVVYRRSILILRERQLTRRELSCL